MINFNNRSLPNWARVIDIDRPLFAPINVTSANVSRRSGSLFFSKRFESAAIQVLLRINTTSRAVLRQRIRDLAVFFHTEGLARLIFSDEPDKYINATVGGESPISETAVFGDILVNFYCPDPFWYAINDDIRTITSTGNNAMVVRGTAHSYPLINIRGVSTTGFITIATGGNSMRYTGALANGEVLVLDSELMTAFIQRANTRIPVMHRLSNLDFLVLTSGSNTINVVTSNFTLQNVVVEARARWL